MEDKDLQEEKKLEEQKKEVKEETPKGYHSQEIATQTGFVIVKDGKQVLADELLIKVANAVEKAGLFK